MKLWEHTHAEMRATSSHHSPRLLTRLQYILKDKPIQEIMTSAHETPASIGPCVSIAMTEGSQVVPYRVNKCTVLEGTTNDNDKQRGGWLLNSKTRS